LFPVKLYSISKRFWNIIFAFFVLFFICIQFSYTSLQPITNRELSHCATFLFHTPDIIIFVVMVTSLYYLSNLGFRFCELNRLWKCLPSGLIALPAGGWTNSDITMLAETIRLLHSELSELLRFFSLGYGPVLLLYFTFTFTHALIETFHFTIYNDLLGNNILPYIFYLQHIFHMISIISVTSWVIDKVSNIFLNNTFFFCIALWVLQCRYHKINWCFSNNFRWITPHNIVVPGSRSTYELRPVTKV